MSEMKKILQNVFLTFALIVLSASIGFSQIPAFPGAEGFGSTTPGGRGGRIILVTNLNDSGPGSFRDAVTQSGPRIVIFRIGGTITTESKIKIENPYLTIAGQTTPGGGIAIRTNGGDFAPIKIKTHDIIMRHVRLRPGPGGDNLADALTISGEDAHSMIFDHCSFTWGVDETISTYTGDPNQFVRNLTFQWSIISDALDCSTHHEGCHSKGLLLQYAENISMHHNLFANNGARSPMILSGAHDVVNNVVHNFGGSAVKIENRYGEVHLNYVGNYIEPGPDSDPTENGIQVKTPGIFLYLKDNYASHVRPNNSYPEEAIVNFREPGTLVDSRYDFPVIATSDPQTAYEQVLNFSGATVPQRDRVDIDIVKKVRDKTSRIIDDPSDVGGYPFLESGTPPVDSDSDGMPDAWEFSHGLDPNNPDDGPMDKDSDGYTNVEEYLNSLAAPGPISPTPTSIPLPTITSSLTPSPTSSPVPTVTPLAATHTPIMATPVQTVDPSSTPSRVSITRIASSHDDVEEFNSSGAIYVDSSRSGTW